jgi:ketosteroid isomerase-like protein
VIAQLSDDVESTDSGGLGVTGSAAGTRHGPEGFLRSIEEALEAFEDYHVEPEDFIDAGDIIVVPVRISGRGRGSGLEMEMRLAHLWALGSDGKVVRSEIYETTAEALKAAGLSE